MRSREIRLKARPVGEPGLEHFELGEAAVPAPGDGEVTVRNLYMSVDPYMRGRMYDRPSYVPPFALGAALEGGAVGEVVESAAEGLAKGDLVASMMGWREAFTAPASTLEKLPALEGIGPQAFLGVMGMPGLTAWAGLTEIGQPQAGETLLVSGAAGAVGSVVCQIGKARGLTVVGIAGSDAKCEWLAQAGVDHAINYRSSGTLVDAVRQAAPRGIDIYFDNVGGEQLEAALDVARPFARFVMCGMIAQYNATEPPAAPRNLIYLIGKSLKMQGFIVTQFQHLRPRFHDEMGTLIREGKMRWEETVVEGIEAAPQAFIGLFSGANLGKMLVKL